MALLASLDPGKTGMRIFICSRLIGGSGTRFGDDSLSRCHRQRPVRRDALTEFDSGVERLSGFGQHVDQPSACALRAEIVSGQCQPIAIWYGIR